MLSLGVIGGIHGVRGLVMGVTDGFWLLPGVPAVFAVLVVFLVVNGGIGGIGGIHGILRDMTHSFWFFNAMDCIQGLSCENCLEVEKYM